MIDWKPIPQYAPINIATTGDHTIIPAPGTKQRIGIFAIFMKAGGTVTVIYKDGDTAMTGAIPQAVNSGEVVSFPKGSPMVLGKNNAFKLELSADIQVSGFVLFRKLQD